MSSRVVSPFLLGCSIQISLLAVLWTLSCAQECSPPALKPSHKLNLFDEQQEYDLGEISAQYISFSLHVIEDEEVAGRLQALGNRLVSQMPPTKLRFRFFVVDSPEANAFAIPGGRVYVTRRLITTVRSEDELAGVIGHEMGHQLAHHGALDWSRTFSEVLGVTSVKDRADIEDKFNQYLDIYRTKGRRVARGNEEHEQTGADQVAIYAVARAGYSPQAVIEFWDRFADTKGNKGTWFSDFFGTIRPETKRLREFVKDLSLLPKGCIQQDVAASRLEEFAKWQTTVRNYRGFGKKESLHHVVLKRSLDPPLRTDIVNFRFSADGKYLLAQDSSGIFVLTREPLTSLFHIDAPDALAATFSPDSLYVVVPSQGLRVERWNIAEQRLEDVREPYVYRGCLQSAFSPDGSYLACLRPDRETLFPLTFTLYDTDSGSTVLTKKDVVGPIDMTNAIRSALYFYYLGGTKRQFANMEFSPDGRYFLLGSSHEDLLIDLTSGAELKMSGPLRRVVGHSFAFVGSDEVVGADGPNLQEASIVKVPTGEVVSEHIHIGGRRLYPVTHGSFAIVRPMLKAPLGIIDLEARNIFRASHKDAIDVFGDLLVSERMNGEVGLYHLRDEKPFTTLILPKAPLGHLSAVSVAPHATAVAISQMTRGAVWNLQTGEQLASGPGFRGSFFDKNSVYMDFFPLQQFEELPKEGETLVDVRRREAEKDGDILGRLDLATQSATPISTFKKRTHSRQFGSVLLTWTPADNDQPRKDVMLEAREVQAGKVIWSRSYTKGFPWIQGDGELGVFAWNLAAKEAKEELHDDPEAKQLASKVWESESSYLVEVVDLRSGTAISKFPIDTGNASFAAREFLASGGTVAMVDTNNRISLYSNKGERRGRLFGGAVALSPDGHSLCAEREPGRLILYDLDRLQQLDEMTFGSRVAYVRFTPDSSAFVVLTADQTAYVFASSPGPPSP